MKKTFYHYTSIFALFSIITSNTLRLSNLKNSNDPNEFYLTCDEYNDYVKKLNQNPYNGRPYILEENKIYGNTYGVSLTLLGDSLNHWERYGDGMEGVSICFDINYLQKALEEKFSFTLDFDAVKYTEPEKKAFIKKKIEKIISLPKCPVAQWTMEAIYFIDHFNQAQMLFKKSGFRTEREYRLYFDPTYFEFFHNMIMSLPTDAFNALREKNNKQFQNVKNYLKLLESNKAYSLMRNGINSYISLDLGLVDKRKFIKEIILGPKCKQDIKELQNFLNDYGYNVAVRKSSIEIR